MPASQLTEADRLVSLNRPRTRWRVQLERVQVRSPAGAERDQSVHLGVDLERTQRLAGPQCRRELARQDLVRVRIGR